MIGNPTLTLGHHSFGWGPRLDNKRKKKCSLNRPGWPQPLYGDLELPVLLCLPPKCWDHTCTAMPSICSAGDCSRGFMSVPCLLSQHPASTSPCPPFCFVVSCCLSTDAHCSACPQSFCGAIVRRLIGKLGVLGHVCDLSAPEPEAGSVRIQGQPCLIKIEPVSCGITHW